MLALTLLPLPSILPGAALSPILPADTQPQTPGPWPKGDNVPKKQGRTVEIGDIEVEFYLEGASFEGEQRIKSVTLVRPQRYVSSARYGPQDFRAALLRETEYTILRVDDDSEAVHVVDISENELQQDRLAIRFRCLDLSMSPQDASGLITVLIVQGLRRALYLKRVEYLDYTELDTGVSYTRLWNQR